MANVLRGHIAGFASQATTSATNLLGLIMLARWLSPSEFGAVAVSVGLLQVALGVTRCLVSEPMLVERVGPISGGEALAAALICSVTLGAAAASLALALHGPIRVAIIGGALAWAPVLIQDTYRYLCFANHRPTKALLSDIVWMCASAIGLIVLDVTNRGSLLAGLWAWFGGAAVALLTLPSYVRSRVRLRSAVARLRSRWWLSKHYLLEFAVTGGGNQVSIAALPVLVSLGAAGAVRGAQLLFGPLVVVFAGMYPIVLPRAVGRQLPAMRRLAVLITAVSVLAAVAWTGILLAAPDSLKESLLGETWVAASELVLPTGVMFACTAIGSGPIIAMRGMLRQDAISRTRLVALPAMIVLPLAAGTRWDARAYVLTLAVCACGVGAALWLLMGSSNDVEHSADGRNGPSA